MGKKHTAVEIFGSCNENKLNTIIVLSLPLFDHIVVYRTFFSSLRTTDLSSDSSHDLKEEQDLASYFEDADTE